MRTTTRTTDSRTSHPSPGERVLLDQRALVEASLTRCPDVTRPHWDERVRVAY